jgi:hypothetical protein
VGYGLRDLVERDLDVLGRDRLRLGDRGGEERVVGRAVGLSEQAVRRLVDGRERRGLEERQLAARELQSMGRCGPISSRAWPRTCARTAMRWDGASTAAMFEELHAGY